MTTLYTISNLIVNEGAFRAEIIFNPAHPVFVGHFPGKPIVPGVVLVEISAAVASQITGRELIVKEASVIKFLRVIEPLLNPVVKVEGTIFEETDGRFKTDLIITAGDVTFAKLRGIRMVSA